MQWLEYLKKKFQAMQRSSFWLVKVLGQAGEFGIQAIVGLAVGMMVIGAVVVALWDKIADTDTAIQALTGTDAGTTSLQSFWPIVITLAGIGIGVAVLIWVLRKLDLV